MMKLILRLPRDANAELLMQTALALATLKKHRYYHFGVDSTECGECGDYENYDLVGFTPSYVTNPERGVSEYETEAYYFDLFLVETLAELQTLTPFEFFFENRGKFNPSDWKDNYTGSTFADVFSA